MKNLVTVAFLVLSGTLFSQQKDSLVTAFSGDMQVFKNVASNTYFIKKQDKTVLKKLKFVANLFGNYLQILDKDNTLFYLNPEARKDTHVSINLGLCGTVPHYTYKIIDDRGQYIVTQNETFYDHDDQIPAVAIDSVSKSQVDKAYFSNAADAISFTDNDFIFSFTKTFPYALMVEKGDKKGILWHGKLSFFDEVLYDRQGIFKVKQNGKYGYFGITKVDYAEIDSFAYGLARIKTSDGKFGYVDRNGNEYLD